MKYILINGLGHDIGGFTNFKPVLLGSLWSGYSEVSDEKAKELLAYKNVDELTEAQAIVIKKKVNGEAIAYRSFETRTQDSSKNPNAVYAEKSKPESPTPKENPKDLLKVETVKVDRPLEDVEAKKTKPKRKAKK